jgi:hypothetical protein
MKATTINKASHVRSGAGLMMRKIKKRPSILLATQITADKRKEITQMSSLASTRNNA